MPGNQPGGGGGSMGTLGFDSYITSSKSTFSPEQNCIFCVGLSQTPDFCKMNFRKTKILMGCSNAQQKHKI